jgi:hypothetical protein
MRDELPAFRADPTPDNATPPVTDGAIAPVEPGVMTERGDLAGDALPATTAPAPQDPWTMNDSSEGDLAVIRRTTPIELIPRLVAEFGYSLALMPWSTKSEAQSVAEQLAWSKRAVREAFLTWWTTGEIENLEVRGVRLVDLLASEEAYRPVRAFLRLARIARDQSDDDAAIGLRAEEFTSFADEFRASMGRLDDQVYLVRHVSAFPEMIYEVYNADGPEGPALRIEELAPGPEAWDAFWEVVDALDVWSWTPSRFVAPRIDLAKGTSWSIALKRKGRAVKLSGHNAYPDLELFQVFAEAVRVLLGTYYFPRPTSTG